MSRRSSEGTRRREANALKRLLQPADAASRRDFLRASVAGTAAVSAGLGGIGSLRAGEDELPPDLRAIEDRSTEAPTAPVSLTRCKTYEREKLAVALRETFDRIGGLEKLLKGKSVTMKLNITGDGRMKMAGLPADRTYQTHPNMVEVLCRLFRQAGARRIVLVESYYSRREPEEVLAGHGWDTEKIKAAGDHRVVFADTRNRGEFQDYAELDVPYGGFIFPRYSVNRHYVDNDVFVSLAKLKNHVTAGITCAVKNLFGMAPTSLYGNDAPNERTTQNRGAQLHEASREPPEGLPRDRFPMPEDIAGNRRKIPYYRVPRVTADLFAARPVDLAIVDGIASVAGGEGPWCPRPHRATQPGLIIAGRNGVTTDTVSVGVMGYDPEAGYAEHPYPGENHLRLLSRTAVGTSDLARIEVRGLSLEEALYEYHPEQEKPGWVKRQAKRG